METTAKIVDQLIITGSTSIAMNELLNCRIRLPFHNMMRPCILDVDIVVVLVVAVKERRLKFVFFSKSERIASVVAIIVVVSPALFLNKWQHDIVDVDVVRTR